MDGKEYLISIICSKCTVTIHCCGCKPSMWKPIPCVLWYTDCWYTCIGFSHCCSTVLYDIQTVDILISATDVPQQRRIWTGGGTTPAPGSTPPSTTPRACSSTCRWLAKSLWCVPPSAHGYLMLTSLQLSAHSCNYWLKSLQSKAYSRAKCVIMYNVLFCDWRFSVITMVTLGGRTFLFTAVVPRCLTYPTTPKTQRVPATRQKITPSRYATLAALFILVVYNV